MFNQPVLVFDVSSVCYSVAYAMGGLHHDGIETTAFYGMMKRVLDLVDIFDTRRIAFAFDGGHSKRLTVCSTYKESRYKNRTPKEIEFHENVKQQINKIRMEYLPDMGFKNIFFDKGYEADDCIASFVINMPRDEEAIMVSSDEDLFQLLSPNVSQCLPKGKMVTYKSFVKDYGIDPFLWADVKSLAGCASDNVIGVRGVGEKKAIQYITGSMNPDSKTFKTIVENGEVWKKNLSLVRLPFPGVKEFRYVEDDVDEHKWDNVCRNLGFRSLIGKGRFVGRL